MALGDPTYRGVIKQASAFAAVPVTPDANTDLPDGICRGLLVGTGGTATIIDAGGNQRANVPLQAGYNWIAVRRVISLGTAADLWALY